MREFKLQWREAGAPNHHDVLAGYWPAYPPAPLTLPKELLDHQEAFEKFYLSKHQGR